MFFNCRLQSTSHLLTLFKTLVVSDNRELNMHDQTKLGVQEAGKDGLPAYTTDPSVTSSWESQAPLDYESQKSESMSMAATSSPYHPFPAVMNAYAQWGQLKSFNICGESERDRLYAFEVHTGYSGKKPLGTRPGMLLHNGTSSKDPILATAGDESQLGARVYAFNLESIILMPPLRLVVHADDHLITERMGARTSGDHVAFSFLLMSVSTRSLGASSSSRGKLRRELMTRIKRAGLDSYGSLLPPSRHHQAVVIAALAAVKQPPFPRQPTAVAKLSRCLYGRRC